MNEKLRTARQQLGLSMINVAAAVGINANTYSRYEKSVTVPNISTAAKIAALFGLPAEYFWDNLRGAQAEEQHELICSARGKHISSSKKAVCKTCAYQGVTVSDSIRKLREVCKTYIVQDCEGCTIDEFCKKPISKWRSGDFCHGKYIDPDNPPRPFKSKRGEF